MSFSDTGLDPRLLRAIAKRGLSQPTPVQLEAIPRTLEGKDVVARARTGSGKTLAYLLPALHRLLNIPQSGTAAGSFQALVLVPSRELCEQVRAEAQAVASHCGDDVIRVTSLVADGGAALRRAIATAGHMVVSTPGKVAAALKEGVLTPTVLQQRLQVLVLDEADLLLTYGYEEDLQLLVPLVPRTCQCMLMSATVSEDVERLTKLVLHNPITLNLLHAGLQGPGTSPAAGSLGKGSGISTSIEHFQYPVETQVDKLLVLMAALKLGLVRKKVLVFVNSVDQAYKVKLFLDSFGVKVALLNAEMPLNSRSHCLQSFNQGLFDYLVATDDVHAPAHDGSLPGQQPGKKRKRQDATGSGKPGRRSSKDEEFGVTRGIDFKGVHTVINFDLPSSLQGYVHRVGRTGRAGDKGIAITLLAPSDAAFAAELSHLVSETSGTAPATKQAGTRQPRPPGQAAPPPSLPEQPASCDGDAAAAAALPGVQSLGIVSGSDSDSDDDIGPAGGACGAAAGSQPSEASGPGALRLFPRLSPQQVDSLRYRGEDVARSITKNVIKEARAREVKAALLNSDKLKEYFEEHAAERALLKHDKALHRKALPAHLGHLPAYLKDPSLVQRTATGNAGPAPLAAHKRRKLPRSKESHIVGTAAGPGGAAVDAVPPGAGHASSGRGDKAQSNTDPLKAVAVVKGFVKVPQRGAHNDEAATDMEKRAMEKGLKDAKRRAKAMGLPRPGAPGASGPGAMKKGNVRKFKRRR